MTPVQLSKFLREVDAEFHIGPNRLRLVVRHMKKGRSHFHIAISEVDPVTLRVLDCRNDYTRLEAVARRYEQDNGEIVQPTRTERRQSRLQGFSDVSRKRAERTAPTFDRTKLKKAFSSGHQAFARELVRQGLQIGQGDKGPILVSSDGCFVAAANRVAGIKRHEFANFMKGFSYDGNNFRVPDADVHGAEHEEATATLELAGGTRRAGSRSQADGGAHAYLRLPATTSRSLEGLGGQSRSAGSSIGRRFQSERQFIASLGRIDLDDLLRRAEDLANWMLSVFESPASRLTREIEAFKKMGSIIVPADASKEEGLTYGYGRRMKP